MDFTYNVVAMNIILFNLTLRLYLARIVIACSLGMVTTSIYSLSSEPYLQSKGLQTLYVLTISLYIFVLLHHTTTMIFLRFFWGIIDLMLLTLEIVGVTSFVFGLGSIPSWFPEVFILYGVLSWVTCGSLVGLLILRIATIVRSRGRALIEPFNIHADQPQSPRKTSFINLMMGRSIWMVHFVGEQKQLRIFRGSMGLIFLCTLLFWILQKIIFEPMKETALGPIKEYRTLSPPIDFVTQVQNPVWNILFAVRLNSTTQFPVISADKFWSAVNVEALWNPDNLSTNITLPDCTQNVTNPDISDGLYFYGFLCHGVFLPDGQPGDNDPSFLFPDLVITVNFTKLNPGVPMSNRASVQNVNYIIIGLTESTSILKRTLPVALIPGINIVASIVSDLRQIYSRPALAALGIFQTTSLFWQSRIVSTYQNPQADFHQDVSTLRLFFQGNWGDTHVIQDYRQNSVIAGFAGVGGLWTTLSGIFALLFGASMLQILYGQKPLSIFGLAHAFNYQHMKEETLRQYPNIIKEHEEGPHRGLLSLIRDHLIGLSFIDELGPSQAVALPKDDEELQASSDKEEQQHVPETAAVPPIRPRFHPRPSHARTTYSAEKF